MRKCRLAIFILPQEKTFWILHQSASACFSHTHSAARRRAFARHVPSDSSRHRYSVQSPHIFFQSGQSSDGQQWSVAPPTPVPRVKTTGAHCLAVTVSAKQVSHLSKLLFLENEAQHASMITDIIVIKKSCWALYKN